MKKIKTTITYRVPSWDHCNHEKMFSPSKEKCRFCVPNGKGFRCTLHNEPLTVTEDLLVNKAHQCVRASAGFGGPVEEVDSLGMPPIDPALIMKVAINGYIKTYNGLINQGYPAGLAEEVAKKYMMEG